MFEFLQNTKLNYGLMERAKGLGLNEIYSVSHTRLFVFLTCIASFFYSLGIIFNPYTLEVSNYHYWFFTVVFIGVLVPLHLIGIPLALSKKYAFKFQNLLYILKANYMFFILSFFAIVPFLNIDTRGRVNSGEFINNRSNYMKFTFTMLIVIMCIMLVFAFFYVRRQVINKVYSKENYNSQYVVIPGIKSKSTYSLGAVAGFQILFVHFIGRTFGTFEVTVLFTIVMLYCNSFLFIENLFILYIRKKYNVREQMINEAREVNINWKKVFQNSIKSFRNSILETIIIGSLLLFLIAQVILFLGDTLQANIFRWIFLLTLICLSVRILYLIVKKIKKH